MAISSLFKDRLSDQKRLKEENFASWSNLTVAVRARQLCAIAPDTVTHVDADIYLTVNQALQQAESLAQSLWQQDFREGDVLAFITPNWHEAVVINLAACLLGLVYVPSSLFTEITKYNSFWQIHRPKVFLSRMNFEVSIIF